MRVDKEIDELIQRVKKLNKEKDEIGVKYLKGEVVDVKSLERIDAEFDKIEDELKSIKSKRGLDEIYR